MKLKQVLRFNPTTASTMLAALLTIVTLTIATACLLQRVTSRLQTAHRSIAWNEALTTAEAGADMAIADITSLLPDVRVDPQNGVSLGLSQLPTDIISSLKITSLGTGLTNGELLTFSPAPLTHGGEGGGTQTATISIDVLLLSDLLNGNLLNLEGLTGLLSNPLSLLNGKDMKLIRLRSRGTVTLPGRRMVDPDSADAQLRQVSLRRDRITKTNVTTPQVTREVEVLLKPVLPFQSAVSTAGSFVAGSTSSVFDSYNSLTSLNSTSGRYDVTKRLKNGDVNAGSSSVTLGGTVYGDVRTNGSSVAKTEKISGNVDNGYAQPLPLFRTPTWSATSTDIAANANANAGGLFQPTRYKYGKVAGNLRIKATPLIRTTIEVWVTGDITGTITVDPGVTAKIYVGGNMTMATGALVNGDQKPASLQIYGLSDAATTPTIELAMGDLNAAIYAPSHKVKLTGNGDFSGAIACAGFEATDAAHVHFDEGLALDVGPVLNYALASWIERDL